MQEMQKWLRSAYFLCAVPYTTGMSCESTTPSTWTESKAASNASTVGRSR